MDGFGVLISIVAFILGLVALNKQAKLETHIAQLKLQLGLLGDEIARLRAGGVSPVESTVAEGPEPQAPTDVPVAEPLVTEQQGRAEEAPPQPAENWQQPLQPEPAAPPQPARDMEQALASRWFVWIGGVAIAIGGLLFVKYAYDNGLISPTLQVILGLIVGALLVASGELVRRRASSGMAAADNYVPAALSAAGLATLFASIYAAFALYELIGPTVAFGGLALVALGSLALSRWQGPLIAALGLIGSYVTPALIPSADPSAWSFFPYLLVILIASFATLRGKDWWWLGYAAIAGSAGWTLLWIKGGVFEPADLWPVGLFAHVLGVVAFYGLKGRGILDDESGDLRDARTITQPLAIGLFGLAAGAVLLLLLVDHTGHDLWAIVLLAVAVAGLVVVAWMKSGVSLLAPLGGLLLFVALMAWNEAAFHDWAMDERGLWSSVPGPAAGQFLRWMLGAATALTIIGIAGTLTRPRPLNWGLLAGAAGVLFIVGSWGRVDLLLSENSWAGVAAIIAALLVAGVWLSRGAPMGDRQNAAAGLLAAGSAGLMVFALDRVFDHVWLTIAIAVLATLYALSTRVLTAWLLGPVTAALATLATIRLFVSRELWSDDRTMAWGQHWVIYGYGVPAILFLVASRWLKAAGHLRSAVALEGISLGLVISLVSLELRVLIGGGFLYDEPQFLEVAAHILTWLGAAYGLMYRQRLYSSFISLWGARVLIAASVAAIVLLSLIALNPIVTEEIVPGNVIFNALLLAYLAPVILIGLIAMRLDVIGWQSLKPAAGGLALVLAFVYLTLETKRVFQGPAMVSWSLSIAESYAYSAVWLGFALALFGAGIRLGKQYIRYAGLGVMVIVVLKVFLWDMSSLEGLYRIASFIGLGLCLVGIGWLYQRFVQKAEKRTT